MRARSRRSNWPRVRARDRPREFIAAVRSWPSVFLARWRLRAQAFDAAGLKVSGDVLTVADRVALDTNERAAASVSASGALVYQSASGSDRPDLLLVDRTGRTIKTIAASVLTEGGIAVSHDGGRLAAAVTVDGARDTDIWIYDLARGTSSPLTFDEGGDRIPIWSADDKEIVYDNDRKNDGIIYRRFTEAGAIRKSWPQMRPASAHGDGRGTNNGWCSTTRLTRRAAT